jgi:2-polyprenyl-3-methyl-5-hydroxy-6-metoxy-1,4-benzoquinol methylase
VTDDASPSGAARYDEIAGFYDGVIGEILDDPASVALLELLPDLRGRRALDVACGQGRVSRELARRGASVVGVDISAALLDRARTTETQKPLGITYVEADATSSTALDGQTFHLVISHFGVSDIDDFGALAANVVRWLEPDASFVFSTLHPCFPGLGDDAPSSWPPGESYFTERWWLARNTGFRGKVGSSHRKLSTYLNALIESGLTVDRLSEPKPDAEWVRRNNPTRTQDVGPVFLVVRLHRPPSPSA